MQARNCFLRFAAALLFFLCFISSAAALHAADDIPVDFSEYHRSSGITAQKDGPKLHILWPTAPGESGTLTLNLQTEQPLIAALGTRDSRTRITQPVVTNLNPVTLVTVGQRDLTKPEGWVVFFDKTYTHPHQTYAAVLTKRQVHVTTNKARCTIRIGDLAAGPFHGALEITVYANSRLIRFDSVLRTEENGKALLYDAGLASRTPDWQAVSWHDTQGKRQAEPVYLEKAAQTLAVDARTVVAESAGGSLALFPPPHQFFYPLDFVTNLGFAWRGTNYRDLIPGYGFGIRQPLEGDKRWVPWFNAPPNVDHHLSFYCLVTPGNAETAQAEVRRFTRGDRFKALPGYRTFTSHYHIEHTLGLVNRQRAQKTTGIPDRDVKPAFVTAFKQKGVDIVHLAEFHVGDTPRMNDARRLPLLKTLHDECARLSDDSFLLLPGEEPNVHLGGHWISLFPKPVYWVLNRPGQTPFVEQVADYGTVYHVGSSDDVLRLMEKENGLMWTAHARIKASRSFPDTYWKKDFFRSGHFLGAAWKAMPADLSLPRLGTRVLDLLDDMANDGLHKTVIGEVDAFEVEPSYELYGPMNMNYIKLDRIPQFKDGWQSVLDSLRSGTLFVTTGEVLLPGFTVNGVESGGTVTSADLSHVTIAANLEWTFPLAYAEVISGDGTKVYRQRIDLSDTAAFGTRTLKTTIDLRGRKWVRLEVWDTAVNGAFTNPVWLK